MGRFLVGTSWIGKSLSVRSAGVEHPQQGEQRRVMSDREHCRAWHRGLSSGNVAISVLDHHVTIMGRTGKHQCTPLRMLQSTV